MIYAYSSSYSRPISSEPSRLKRCSISPDALRNKASRRRRQDAEALHSSKRFFLVASTSAVAQREEWAEGGGRKGHWLLLFGARRKGKQRIKTWPAGCTREPPCSSHSVRCSRAHALVSGPATRSISEICMAAPAVSISCVMRVNAGPRALGYTWRVCLCVCFVMPGCPRVAEADSSRTLIVHSWPGPFLPVHPLAG